MLSHLIFFSLVLAAHFSGLQGANCGSFTASDGSNYNLTGLTRDPAVGYQVSQGSYTYYFNLCENYYTSTIQIYCYAIAPVYQMSVTNLCYLLGTLPPVIKEGINGPATGVTIVYRNEEDRCQFGTLPRIVNINVKCDQKITAVTGLTEPSTCVYDIAMTHPAACPIIPKKAGGSMAISGGSLFLILLLVIVVIYLVGGVIFRYKFQDVDPGIDLIPNLPFWTMIPGLVKDGCIFTYTKVRGLIQGN